MILDWRAEWRRLLSRIRLYFKVAIIAMPFALLWALWKEGCPR